MYAAPVPSGSEHTAYLVTMRHSPNLTSADAAENRKSLGSSSTGNCQQLGTVFSRKSYCTVVVRLTSLYMYLLNPEVYKVNNNTFYELNQRELVLRCSFGCE